MKYYFAPMEGITGYVYRNAHHRIYGHMDQYFSPFLVPGQTKKLSSREINDILPEHNRSVPLVPQVMTNKAADFLWAARQLKDLGYTEINLNLGCPSATVVTKNRGSGFLAFPKELDRFLAEVADGLAQLEMELSVKTRIGKEDPEEFPALLEIFNRYSLKKLIIHPRIQTDFYKNHPNLEVFARTAAESVNPVCYNGDLFTAEALADFRQRFPQVQEIMIGRGLLANPAMVLTDRRRQQADLLPAGSGEMLEKKRLREFHDLLLDGYVQVMCGDRNVLFKMKELWFYLGCSFENYEKYGKKIKKVQKLNDYIAAVDRLFAEQELKAHPGFAV